MKTLREQIDNQVKTFTLNTRHAVILRDATGRPKPFFVWVNRVVVGKTAIHMEKLIKVKVSSGVEWGAEQFRITRSNDLASEGWGTITDDQAQAWIEEHKAGIEARK